MQPIVSAMRWARSVTNEEQRKIAKFVLVGVVRTACSVGLYYFLLLSIGLHFGLALAGEYVLAFSTGYVLNRSWTFANQGSLEAAFSKYAVAFALAFVMDYLLLEVAIGAGMGPRLGRIPALVLATVVSYLLQRYWVFKGH